MKIDGGRGRFSKEKEKEKKKMKKIALNGNFWEIVPPEICKALILYLCGGSELDEGVKPYFELYQATAARRRYTCSEAARRASVENGKKHKSKNPTPAEPVTPVTPPTTTHVVEKVKRFTPPTLVEVAEYITTRPVKIDAENFINFYSSKGWRVGNQPMRDWRACVRTWERRLKEAEKPSSPPDYSTGF